ncbi:tyrosine-protein phosphatase [Liquorilactobacillus satsumensis]|uniref:Protein tyrosine phosphatase n=1 Tax=Liquorilactobacillus satsumensis DSM 16230 = JCM 12392 TaxID=1423801 RepID=A0A0R1UW02_9LACO|nr:tyrosine-protein phosphatase [Liquorilactobacillus satsumensis]KRL97407.1 hypothetical protein FD50_GL001387 [Liquorilactobacillus satsumensis DSM 16230 = JCM 12392]MCC7667284.1 protein-tyrosine-phosphatase [Liquorilactobacillus satsumensis]MCP9312415.1 tyrosine-protein phosphatase [Liquorilactobacillus satsumensis]MCP9327610.1 tyrosine-protein phosphatase [Liquorilactobacillus satsumensis]MCP9357118.1 tyrosine-protein phosphatase [Liquorilactobacillus satsumensis]
MKKERILSVPGSINLRELGGYPTKDGQVIRWKKLLRSGDMSRLTIRATWQLARYGLAYDIDLRSPFEHEMAPDQIPKSTSYLSYPVYPLGDGEHSDLPIEGHETDQKEDFLHPYEMMVMNKHAQLAFRMLFATLLQNEQPDKSVLFHCAAGKDRTGVAGFLVLSALGVDYTLIKRDYLLTNLVYETSDQHELRKKLQNDNLAAFINDLNSSFNVQGASLDAARQVIIKNYGSIQEYLVKAMQLSAADLADLRRLYLQKN